MQLRLYVIECLMRVYAYSMVWPIADQLTYLNPAHAFPSATQRLSTSAMLTYLRPRRRDVRAEKKHKRASIVPGSVQTCERAIEF